MFSTSIVDHTTPRKLCVQIPGREYISGMQVITLTHNRKLVVFNVTLTGSLVIERPVITKCTTCCNIKKLHIFIHSVLTCLFGGHSKHPLFLKKLVCLCDGPRLSSLWGRNSLFIHNLREKQYLKVWFSILILFNLQVIIFNFHFFLYLLKIYFLLWTVSYTQVSAN